MAANTKPLEEAIELAKKATEADNEQKYEEALPLYIRAIEVFCQVVKDKQHTTLRVREVITRKCQQYIERAEAIKKIVAGAEGTVCVTKKEGSGHVNNKGNEKDDLDNEYSETIVRERPNVKWDDIVGLEQTKEALKEVILPMKFPQLFQGARKPFRRGVLLYGPPGTGKTYLAKAVATEASCNFFSIDASRLMSPWIGDSERIIRKVFRLARANKPALVFIDELDCISSTRSDCERESTRRIKTELLIEMDGADNDGIVVLGATNIPWELDGATRRRFEKRLYIPLPEAEARRHLIEHNIGKAPCDLTVEDLSVLAKMTEGYSRADISIVVREALMMPIRKVRTATHFKKVRGPMPSDPTQVVDDLYTPCGPRDPGAIEMTWMDIPDDKLCAVPLIVDDFMKTLEHTTPSIREDELKQFVKFTEEFQ